MSHKEFETKKHYIWNVEKSGIFLIWPSGYSKLDINRGHLHKIMNTNLKSDKFWLLSWIKNLDDRQNVTWFDTDMKTNA